MAVVAGLIGALVIVQEIPFWGSRTSNLWQVLTALGVGLVVLAIRLHRNAKQRETGSEQIWRVTPEVTAVASRLTRSPRA